jgi:hypothetical protein
MFSGCFCFFGSVQFLLKQLKIFVHALRRDGVAHGVVGEQRANVVPQSQAENKRE